MITGTDVKKTYACDGAQQVFPIPFAFREATDIVVKLREISTGIETDWTQPADYSVDMNGNVVAVSAPSASYTLWIFRETPHTQPNDLVAGDDLPAQTLEDMNDKITKIAQELAEKITRAILFPRTSSEADHEMPEPEEGYFLRWASGALVNSKAFGGGTYSIQSFMVTFLEAATKAAARTALEITHANLPDTHNLTTDIDHDQLLNFVAAEHRNITYGTSDPAGTPDNGDIYLKHEA